MKIIAVLFLAFVTAAVAQTNTFPTSGNVGIGTTNPVEKLQVNGNILINNGEAAAIYPNGHNLYFGGMPWWAHLTYTFRPSWGAQSATYATIALQKADTAGNFTTVAQIASESGTPTYFIGGNVGIGTASPSNKLTVAKSINTTVDAFAQAPALVVSGSSITSRVNSSVQQILYLHQPNTGDSGYSKGSGFGIGLSFWEDPGCNYPRTRADFQTTGRTTDSVEAGNTVMSLRDDGNVGIGTTAPTLSLDVVTSKPFGVRVYRTVSSSGMSLGADNAGAVLATEGVHAFRFYTSGAERFQINASGNVGIGTTNPTEKLSVKGRIRAQEVIVETANWSDYVFAKDHKLAPLSEVERHIEKEGHLPGVPSAQEVAEKGVSVGDMQAILLAKIEELTLHQIQQEKRLSAQDAKIDSQASKIAALEAENAELRANK